VNFNVLLSKHIVHPLVKIKKNFDNIKMHDTTMKIILHVLRCRELPCSLLLRCFHVIFVMRPSAELTYVLPEIDTEFYCVSSLVRFVLFRI
jgi:hypothetical protein